MYQTVLVDDDVAVLEFLEQLVPWREMGFEVAGRFTRATDALEKCCRTRPDLIITDIGMPELDGLSLIRRLQEDNVRARFVILSCHDEFQYAQQAVQLGVQDYILKETLDVQGMKDVLERVKVKLDEDRSLRLRVDRLYHQAHKSQSALKEKWMRDLLANPLVDDRTLYDQLREFGLNTSLGHFIPVLCRVFSFHDAISRYGREEIVKFVVENVAEELLRNESDVLFFSHSAQECYLLCASRKDLVSNPYDKLVEICKMLQQAFSKYLKLEFSMLVGEMALHGSDIRRQLLELAEMANEFFYFEKPTVMKKSEFPAKANHEDLFIHYSEYSECLNLLLLEENENVEPVIDSFVELIQSRRYRPADVKQMVWKLALDLQLKLKFSLAYDKKKMQQTIEQMMNVGEMRKWLLHFTKEAVDRAKQISRESKKAEIVNAQKYVRMNLDRKITLKEVADRLYLNPSYFSRLFKRETGENFIEFVTRMKMERAKELLSESGNTVEQVALMLGYDNKSYFVKLFKQHFGIPPSRLM